MCNILGNINQANNGGELQNEQYKNQASIQQHFAHSLYCNSKTMFIPPSTDINQ